MTPMDVFAASAIVAGAAFVAAIIVVIAGSPPEHVEEAGVVHDRPIRVNPYLASVVIALMLGSVYLSPARTARSCAEINDRTDVLRDVAMDAGVSDDDITDLSCFPRLPLP